MSDKNQIVVVCTANICRSPMAEALLRHALDAEEEPLRSLKVVSAGVSAYSGEPASANSIKALKSVGIDISQHQSRSISQHLIDQAFVVLGMTRSHLLTLNAYFPESSDRYHLFREFLPEDSTMEIPDPFGADLRAYESCRDSMVEAIPSLLAWFRQEYKPRD